VLSAEPDPAALGQGRKNLSLVDPRLDAPVKILEGGLSDVDDTLELHQSAVLGHSSFASPHHELLVTQATLRRGNAWLTELGVDHIDVMVLNVEGWELRVLRGLEHTLRRSPRLAAIVELSRWALADARTSPAAVVDFIRNQGMQIRWAALHTSKMRTTFSVLARRRECETSEPCCSGCTARAVAGCRRPDRAVTREAFWAARGALN